MNQLHFYPNSHSGMTELTNRIKKGDTNPFITFVFTECQIHIIGGPTDHLLMKTIGEVSDPTQEKTAWSISATAFASFWKGQHTHVVEKKTISLQMHHDKNQRFPILEGITDHNSFRYLKAKAACDAHLTFFDLLSTKPYQHLETTKAKKICSLADNCNPYQVFELNKKMNKIFIERDNDIIPFTLPEDLTVDFSMMLTPGAKDDLQQLANTTKSDTLSVYLDDEQAIFSDGEQVYSHSLAPLRAYRDKQQQHFTLEVKLVIDIFTFKKERENFQQIEELRKANQVLLYITPTKAYLASMLQDIGSVMPLNVKTIVTTQEQLYSINLNALSKVPIKDITNAEQVKMTVLRNVLGEVKLGFHNDRDKEYPYYSVPLEQVPSLLPELKKRLENAKKIAPSHFGEQGDLFGFSDV
ncbi:MAG: hypothetical protein COA47_15500 [Robiginitomaculum sp.]|nr:MAG: hypothetical protein COA47_15500 [Robiginitomaculum sp.]